MWQAFFFESSTKYIPRCRKQCFVFLRQKVFLKGTSPVDHSLQQHKTVLQLAAYFFSFGCLWITHYNSYYTFLTALGELILIITIRVEHATCAFALLLA